VSMREQALTRPSIAPPASFGTLPFGILRRKCACEGSATPCAECGADDRQATLRRRAASDDGPGAAPPIVHDVLRSPGRPLDGETRRYFEPRFGHDFSKVRVHTDQQAAASARSVNAVAYAVGNDIAFESGRYRPGTITGRRLLAHELAHVIQQSGTPRATTLQIGSAADASEKEAESVAARVTEGRAPVPVQRASGSLQRQANDSDPVSNADPPGASPAGSPQPSQTGSGSDASVKAPASPEKPEHCAPPDDLGCATDAAPTAGAATTVSFAVNSSALSVSQRGQIDAAAAAWNSGGATGSIQVDGYASAEYECAYNWQLSCRRAQGVAAELQNPSDGSTGVPAANISVVAHGESDAAGTALAPNRRVTVSIPAPPPKPTLEPDQPPPPSCASPSTCPPDFCMPMSRMLATVDRALRADFMLAGIAAAVSPRVVPLWTQFIFGGVSTTQDISAKFAADFTADRVTTQVNNHMLDALSDDLRAKPPVFPPGKSSILVPIDASFGSSTAAAIAAVRTAGDPDSLTFAGTSIPGNLAGGIGANEAACPAGANPSGQNDDRLVSGTATITQDPGTGGWQVDPNINYTVNDTIDFCPGNCGTGFATLAATVPLSRWEASGISGDVPFTVQFPAPPTHGFTVMPASKGP
jgi:outer membrane protein OmpA-like peptidoglycan-associated protein